ncbi:mitotic deacetylase associated SANT domain protein a isoform X2 [Pleuronectes platessa]|uniref:mitotic deacetylase associated SANT domain protein a isoform X2 n=1 Tax=Pleuronectes platessa TaxID=8262 RepID=UPI00232A79A9|nr:mitotic deacetylase associated SANT domain protein a isoform X2 [Pleuronectes platessa]
MSLPPQINTDKSGKHQAAAMKESVQHSGEVYYGMGPPTLESSHSDSASSSAVYNPDKGPPSLPHYQQAAPVKWTHQDSIQAPGWSQEAPVPAWGQNFGPYMGGVNVRGQMAFHKGVHEGVTLPVGGENQVPAPAEAYRDANQAPAQGRGLEWEQHAVAAMQQAQLQAYQHGHKGAELQGQPHVPPHALQGSMLQPFQSTFRPSKQQFSSGYYSVFPGNKAMPSLAYGEQQKTQQQLLHQMQQQKMHHHHQQQQQQQQQQLQQQHQLQMQQQQHLQQHQHHHIQHHQMQQQQQQLQHMQQYHQQHQLQGRQQQMQQMQQQQQLQQNVPQQDATTQLQVQPKQPLTQNFVGYQSPEPCPPEVASKKEEVGSVEPQTQTCDSSAVSEPGPEKGPADPEEASDSHPAAPRRSRRLSREGQSPLGPPPTNIWPQGSKEPSASQNGVAGEKRGGESQVATGGVIQITRRRRRASKEINLETLAQTASERQKMEDGSSVRQATMVPLVIPVSVPVHRSPMDPLGLWAQGRLGQGERPTAALSDRIPSVIVARRRSLRNSMSESLGQVSSDGENDPGPDADGKSKFKRRPRPEPLIIPPPKPSTFIAPSIYSSISSYQSNLRSPVRMPDHPLILPPYTPPPILSPVREGSGLYFSTLMTSIAVSNQILPLPPTPKTATRSLLRSASSDITPPVLPMITDVTPVSLEPRINIGQQYQADIPDLQDQLSSQFDQLKADLVWVPVENSNLKHGDQESMVDLMNMACSSVLTGGGTNQELVLHCLHECGGDFLETLGRLMLQDPVFPRGHTLAGYHYSGSDSWTAEEKRYFNKGISAYRKDFFLVQKLVQTKTVAQCVEFYYTYKKQVKIGRNSILTFGPPDSPGEKQAEAVVDIKGSHQSKLALGETGGDDKKDLSYDQITERDHQASVAQSLQAHDYAGTMLVIKEPVAVNKEAHRPAAHPRPRADPVAKKPRAPAKPPQDPDAVFPCKKCGRVFNKVKSRSAHMKSHAEQEKKAAALRLKEEEEQAAAEARARKVAAAAAASTAAAANQGGNGNGVTEQVSSHEESSEREDDDDEDWR